MRRNESLDRKLPWVACLLGVALVACEDGGSTSPDGTDAGIDAAGEVGTDAADDGPGTDAGADGGVDGGVDGGSDGGTDAGVDGGTEPGCVSDSRFFEEQVQERLVVPICSSCHSQQGLARDSELVFVPDVFPDYLDRNRAALEHVARLQYDGTPLLLMKPTGRITHGGGTAIPEGSAELFILEEFVARIAEPVVCDDDVQLEPDSLGLLSPLQTLRKASTALRGTLPTADELASVRAGGEAALAAAIDGMLDDDAFFDRLREVYNDLLLTDKYADGYRDALSLLDGARFPARYYHEWADTEAENNSLRVNSNFSLAREPLELIVHVVREGRPFTEVLTADYVMVNDFSAYAYGLLDGPFPSADDPEAFVYREARLQDFPHAGLLSTPSYLARYPSTPTNRNRHRARMLFQQWLATDILALADRPIDPNNTEYLNATRDDPKCNVCHALLDPVAGTFQNWDDGGQFEVPAGGWYPEMLPPGFGREALPSERRIDGVSWLAELAVRDRRFAIAVVQQIWTGFGGLPVLPAIAVTAEDDVAGRREGYRAQRALFLKIADDFIASDYDLRTVIRAVMLSAEFRAGSAEPDAEAWETLAASNARLLTPEQLSRRVEQVTGYPWRERWESSDYMMGRYRMLYGGIDSDGTTKRLDALNGVMNAISERLSWDVSCRTTARDFSLDAADRRLFPFVETSFVPETPEGFAVPEAQQAIRENVRYLHAHVLGEDLALDDAEVDATYALFVDLWREGVAQVGAGTVDDDLPNRCRSTTDFWTGADLPSGRRVSADANYAVRAWIGVLAYLYGDYHFLYE